MKKLLVLLVCVFVFSSCGTTEFVPFQIKDVDIADFDTLTVSSDNARLLPINEPPANMAVIGDSIMLAIQSVEPISEVESTESGVVKVLDVIAASRFITNIVRYDKDTLEEKNRLEFDTHRAFCEFTDNYVMLLYADWIVIDHGEDTEPEMYYDITGKIEYYNENLEKVKEITIDPDSLYANARYYGVLAIDDTHIAFQEYIPDSFDTFTVILDVETGKEIRIDSYDSYKVNSMGNYRSNLSGKFIAEGYLYLDNIWEDTAIHTYFCIDTLTGEITDVIYADDIDKATSVLSTYDLNVYRDVNLDKFIADRVYGSIIPQHIEGTNFACIDLTNEKLITYANETDHEIQVNKVHQTADGIYIIARNWDTENKIYLIKAEF